MSLDTAMTKVNQLLSSTGNLSIPNSTDPFRRAISQCFATVYDDLSNNKAQDDDVKMVLMNLLETVKTLKEEVENLKAAQVSAKSTGKSTK